MLEFTRDKLFFEIFETAATDFNARWFLIYYRALRDKHGRVVAGTARRPTSTIANGLKSGFATRTSRRAKRSIARRCKEIVGSSGPLRRVLTLVEKLADTASTVLITGETGSGKELDRTGQPNRSRR
ncbi:MAG TPA: sigma 54-interacting transcriptional regulator [Steroidobacteraceae bacterium]|nr:sigma 54-interacting transcriptional regulator [Steroidobacteraceae bacterium]